MTNYLSVHTSVSNLSDAKKLSRTLLEEKLIACANILPCSSIYQWQGRVEDSDEVLMILKTDIETYPLLENRLRNLHPYEEPMIVAFAVQNGSKSYLQWISKSLEKKEN